ncbi:MAG: 16S rRNA (uracil(1498)-N(3))-methyltransferase [Myxococcota bacterium]
MVRLFLPVPEEVPAQLRVEGARWHYLARVLRVAKGDVLEVFDGRGRAFEAHIAAASEDHAQLALGSPRAAPPRRPLVLVQGLPKADKLERVLQHGTELGATSFAPVTTARSVVRLSDERAASRLSRWRRIAEEAARQCGRSDIPDVLPVRPLLEAVRALPAGTRILVLDEAARAVTLSQAFTSVRAEGAPVALVVGPEGGLDDEERQALASLGGVPVTLGARVLRTETASLAALALLLHLDGELG